MRKKESFIILTNKFPKDNNSNKKKKKKAFAKLKQPAQKTTMNSRTF